MADIINLLAGIAANDPLDGLRDHRAQAKENAQLSFEALLEPADPKGVSFRDRYAVAAFTGLLGSARPRSSTVICCVTKTNPCPGPSPNSSMRRPLRIRCGVGRTETSSPRLWRAKTFRDLALCCEGDGGETR